MSKGELRTLFMRPASIPKFSIIAFSHGGLLPLMRSFRDSCPQAVSAVRPESARRSHATAAIPNAPFCRRKLPLTCSNHPHTIHMDVQRMVRHGRERIPAPTQAK